MWEAVVHDTDEQQSRLQTVPLGKSDVLSSGWIRGGICRVIHWAESGELIAGKRNQVNWRSHAGAEIYSRNSGWIWAGKVERGRRYRGRNLASKGMSAAR